MTGRSTTASSALEARARLRTPGGVNSNVRLEAPPIYFEAGAGARLTDVDGNDYVDYLIGQGAAFLGHAPQAVLDEVAHASRNGLLYAGRHSLEVEAADLLCRCLGWADMVRFGTTGSEMVQAALRLARAATQRVRFVRFEGHYHGWFDNVLVATEKGQSRPASAGQPPDALSAAVTLPWNDLTALDDAFVAHEGEIAAVLMEPMMLNAGAILPAPGYLEGVRELCDRTGTVLVFDEVVTGFRLSLGGAAERFGVRPDLAVYGKALAAGWPAAALAGRADLLERIGSREVNHSGTFNGNVMSMAAVVTTLNLLADEPPYTRIEELGSMLMQNLRALSADATAELRIQGLPVAFHTSFPLANSDAVQIGSFRDLSATDDARYRDLATALAAAGVWVAARGVWYLSAAHTADDIQVTLERAKTALAASAAT